MKTECDHGVARNAAHLAIQRPSWRRATLIWFAITTVTVCLPIVYYHLCFKPLNEERRAIVDERADFALRGLSQSAERLIALDDAVFAERHDDADAILKGWGRASADREEILQAYDAKESELESQVKPIGTRLLTIFCISGFIVVAAATWLLLRARRMSFLLMPLPILIGGLYGMFGGSFLDGILANEDSVVPSFHMGTGAATFGVLGGIACLIGMVKILFWPTRRPRRQRTH